jgi:beta-glucanase (GH16 family)
MRAIQDFFAFLRDICFQKRTFLAIFATLFVLTAAAFANVLSDPGFEAGNGFTNWSTFGPNNSILTGAGLAHSGTNYYKVYGQFNGTNSYNYTCIYQDNVSTPGATYSANGWAYSLASDKINGEDQAWIEVSFRDSSYNALALYRSPVITSNNISAFGGYSTWFNLQITNQCSYTNATALILLPGTVTGSATSLVAPAGTAYVRFQIVFAQGPDEANGSMYFDDMALNQTGGPVATNTAVQWNIVWSDEFNSNSINKNVWTFELGNNGGWGNNELENYTSTNAFETNGLLHIVALSSGVSYTSVRMKTENNFSFKYGRVVWRAALPAGTGMWPALWMLGNSFSTIGWPACGEVDVMEANGTLTNQVQSSLHFGNSADQDVTETAIYNSLLGENDITNFHTYMLEWDYGSISFYVDSNLFETQTGWMSPDGPYPAPFNSPFFLIMNLAVGGNYVGKPSTNAINAGTVFPAQMLVDYVRVYQKTVPLAISVSQQSGKNVLTWPANIVCHLQAQTNSLLGAWSDLTGVTPPYMVPASGAANAVFYRLESP